MSRTNQICITCTQRDTCQYYDPNRTICVPVKVSDYGQFAGSFEPIINWQHYRIKAAIAAMQAFIGVPQMPFGHIAEEAVKLADALIAELQKKGGQDDNNHQ